LTANVLSSGEPSSWSEQVLQRSNLYDRFREDEEAALQEMRKAIDSRVFPDRLFALAELSFTHAERSGKNEYYLAAAVYAYAFLFPEDNTPQPDPLDPRRRLAADIYNLGLVRGLDSPDGEEVLLKEGKYELPFGELGYDAGGEQLFRGAASDSSALFRWASSTFAACAIAIGRRESAHRWRRKWNHRSRRPIPIAIVYHRAPKCR